MGFIRYQHIERFGMKPVEGIETGTCYVFPKIDGTNANAWADENGNVHAGNRNRELTSDRDHEDILKYVLENDKFRKYFEKYPERRLFGEMLVPMSLLTYKDSAWKKLYVFDVCEDRDGEMVYLPYDQYASSLEEFGIEYIPPIRIIRNGNYESFGRCLDENHYLIKEGQGIGEGIVIKNYEFRNEQGQQNWAKIVTSEFKEKHIKKMGAPVTDLHPVEAKIIDKFVTSAFANKEYAKFSHENGKAEDSKMIEKFFVSAYEGFMSEEIVNILHEFNNPVIDFKKLYRLFVISVKENTTDLFGRK